MADLMQGDTFGGSRPISLDLSWSETSENLVYVLGRVGFSESGQNKIARFQFSLPPPETFGFYGGAWLKQMILRSPVPNLKLPPHGNK